MYKYGECVGIIYQITDDYLDVINSLITKTPVGDLALKIPTLPLTKLNKYPQYKEIIHDFMLNGNTDELLKTIQVEHAQKVFEDLIKPWQDMALKFIEDVPDNMEKRLLQQVPVAFANELISADKN